MLHNFILPLPLLFLITTASTSVTSSTSTPESQPSNEPENQNQNYTCPQHLYTVQIFSSSPLIIYIPSFITESEALHLEQTSSGRFQSSQIADQSGAQKFASTRTSRSTSLLSDPVVACIEERALAFQGYDIPRTHLEPLQAVQYSLSEEYRPHTDWFTSPAQTSAEFGGNRATSFFVYVAASEDIVGGGTQFPLLEAPRDEKWCGVVNCDAGWDEGVTFRPIARNAVFWRNMKEVPGGKGKRVGDKRVLHAGLPVQRGRKLGMNIWTREGALDGVYRSA
jgi:prolyl 4-hydroxylase